MGGDDAPDDGAPPLTILPEVRSWVWSYLKEYQREGIAKVIGRGDGALWWPCGAGKTVAAQIWALSGPENVLVVCRANAREQWADSVWHFTRCQPHVLRPTGNRRKGDESLDDYMDRARREGFRPFLITSWGCLRTLRPEVEQYVDASRRLALVWDESHCAKDYKRAKREANEDGGFDYIPLDTIAAIASRLAPKAVRRLNLTATPDPDRPRDWWSQFDIMSPGKVFAPIFHPFGVRYCNGFQHEYGWDYSGSSRLTELKAHAAPWVHEVDPQILYVQLPPCRRDVTRLDRASLRSTSKDARARVREAAQRLGRERTQEAAEALIAAQMGARATQKDAHLRARAEECAMSGQKLLIFTELRSHVDDLGPYIRHALPPDVPVWASHGGDMPRVRRQIQLDYMAHKGAAVLIGTTAAWGESVDLQDTDRLIMSALPWTWGRMFQAEGRPRRLGQTRPLVIEYVIVKDDPDEEHVVGIVTGKLKANQSLHDTDVIGSLREALRGDRDEIVAGLLARYMT